MKKAFRGTLIGRKAQIDLQAYLCGRRVSAAELLGTGKLSTAWQCNMLPGTAGARALGVWTGQIGALLAWIVNLAIPVPVIASSRGPLRR